MRRTNPTANWITEENYGNKKPVEDRIDCFLPFGGFYVPINLSIVSVFMINGYILHGFYVWNFLVKIL